jgi:hypothetical protein
MDLIESAATLASWAAKERAEQAGEWEKELRKMRMRTGGGRVEQQQ